MGKATEFEKLIGELDTLQKAIPAEDGTGDAKIQAAAGNGGEGDPDNKKGATAEGDGTGDGDGDDKGDGMAKAMDVTLADGTKIKAVDGTEMVKALTDRIDGTELVFIKAMGQAVDLIKSQAAKLTAQGEMIKSLQADFAKISAAPSGRKTLLTVHEKSVAVDPMAKSQPEGMEPEVFMTKALDAQKAGKITGQQVAAAEAALNRGWQVNPQTVAAVLG